jgi:zinc/manganese transport system permease protein
VASGLPIAGFSLDPVSDWDQLTMFPFMVNALESGALVAVAAGLIGWFMVVRRESFAGHTLSVMAFPGASGALLAGLPAAAGYFFFCTVSALVIGLVRNGRESGTVQESAVIGAVQALGLGCGFLFLTLYSGVLGGYETLLFGSFLGITRSQVAALAGVAVVAFALVSLAGRPLLFTSLDESVARARGVPARGLSLGFMVVLGLTVAATAQITGALLVFALLVAPAATAQLATNRIGWSLALTVALGVFTTWAGLAWAFFADEPVGFCITTIAFVLYVVARAARALAQHPWPLRAVPAEA